MSWNLEALLEWIGAENGALFSCVCLRLLPLIAFSPVFGGTATPRRHRMVLVLILGFALHGSLGDQASRMPTHGMELVVVLAREFLLGFALALAVRLVFEGVAACGELVDLTRGATFANVLDPVNQQQTSLTAAFLMHLQIAIFLALGGHRMVLETLHEGFRSWPPGSSSLPERFAGEDLAATFILLFGECMELAVRLSLPVMSTLFVVNVALALINRAAPQIQIFFLAMPLRAVLGLLVLALVLHAVFDELLAIWQRDLPSLIAL